MARFALTGLTALLLVACTEWGASNAGAESDTETETVSGADAGKDGDCPTAGLELPDGFCATVFADNLGPVRHIAMGSNGVLYAIMRSTDRWQGLAALRDADGDGTAETVERFGDVAGTGLVAHGDWLYASSNTAVYRWRLPENGLSPTGEPETIVAGFPQQGQHSSKSIAIGGGRLFVNVGAPSNACMRQSRTPGSPGMDPCPILEKHGGIWHFDAEATDQEYSTEARFAAGIRNTVALAWNPRVEELYLVQHGRDQLHQFFPELYTTEESAELPAEEMFRVDEGDHFGWPYCYYDHRKGKKVLGPEYGGDGDKVGRCSEFEDPVAAFPGHWAPNGLLFYTGDAFPQRYRGGAFIAFHGSWNRAPEPQAGYRVTFVPFDGPLPAGDYETFADGFAGTGNRAAPGQAEYRPMGLAQGPEGELYISDTEKGRVWRVEFTGET